MKMLRFIFVFFLFSILGMQASGQPKTMLAYWSYGRFLSPQTGPYLETYLTISGPTIAFLKESDSLFRADIFVSFIIFKEKDTLLNRTFHFNPEANSLENTRRTFVNLQRFTLPEGDYDYLLTIFDRHRALQPNEKAFSSSGSLKMHFPKDSVAFSDIEIVDDYFPSSGQDLATRGGYTILPKVVNFFGREDTSIKIFSEVYFPKALNGQPYLLTASVLDGKNRKTLEPLVNRKKIEAREAIQIIQEFPLASLSAGQYIISLTVINPANQVVASQELFFIKSGITPKKNQFTPTGILSFAADFNHLDSLKNLISCLSPISSVQEKKYAKTLLKEGTLENCKRYFSDFWVKEDSLRPEDAWLAYKVQMDFTNREFSTKIQQGCESDRGRVHLQYGAPNIRSEVRDEPSAFPYEIWHYYRINRQTDKKFVFYNPDLSTNDYVLLHSDVIGELYNQQWQISLNRRIMPTNNMDREVQPEHFGGKANEMYRDPR